MRSLRVLGKNWKLTIIAVLSLSIAMALGVASLSLSNTFLLLPPSGADPDRLVMIYSHSAGKEIEQISYPDYKYFRENNHVFTDVAAAPNSIQVQGSLDGKREVKVSSRPVSDNYFEVMGVRPVMGRLFAPGDDQSKTPIAVMTYTCWKRLGSDPNIVGQSIAGSTIIGVTPKEFTGSLYGMNGDLLRPLSSADGSQAWFTQRDARRLFLVARLKPGVSRRQAQAEVTSLSAQLAGAYPKENRNRTAVITRATLLPPDAIPDAEIAGGIMIALVLLVVLIACANVANLLLAVAVGRRQEAAIKLALGASRRRLVREFLMESAVISLASAGLGYAITAIAIIRYPVVSIDVPVVGSYSIGLNLHLDLPVAAATLALALIAMLASGLAPALYASAPSVAEILSGEVVVGGTRKNARRNALVIFQVGTCTLVLVGMGLCQRSLYNLRHADPGFSQRNLVAASLFLQGEGFTEARGKQLYGSVRESIAALPGVEAVTLAANLPLLGDPEVPVQFPAENRNIRVPHNFVDPDYFSTLGIRVLSGRTFNSGDRENGQEVIVVNHKMADMFWPGQDPLGKTVIIGTPGRPRVVIGVVADGKYGDLYEAARPFFYYALSQHYQSFANVIARTKGDPKQWVEPMAQAVRKLGLPALARPVTLESWMSVTLLTERYVALGVSVLSALGLLLAVAGLFGAISYSVSQRKKELGIRVALGARRAQLLGMVLRETLRIAGTGVASGIALGVGATTLLRSQFYGISAVEWTVLVPVSAAMLAVSLAVAYFSARPWVTVNPMEAVRHA